MCNRQGCTDAPDERRHRSTFASLAAISHGKQQQCSSVAHSADSAERLVFFWKGGRDCQDGYVKKKRAEALDMCNMQFVRRVWGIF